MEFNFLFTDSSKRIFLPTGTPQIDAVIGKALAKVPDIDGNAPRRAAEIFAEVCDRIEPEPRPQREEDRERDNAQDDEKLPAQVLTHGSCVLIGHRGLPLVADDGRP